MAALFETYAYAVILGIIGITSTISYIVKLIGVGQHAFASSAIGSALGIIIILVSPMAYVAAFIVAGAAAVVSNIILSRVW